MVLLLEDIAIFRIWQTMLCMSCYHADILPSEGVFSVGRMCTRQSGIYTFSAPLFFCSKGRYGQPVDAEQIAVDEVPEGVAYGYG